MTLALLLATTLSAQTGALRVVSLPDVRVIWEGVDLGTTDASGEMLVEGIPFGSYTLELRKPDHQPLTTSVEVTAGRTTVSLRLEPIAPPTPVRREPRQRPAPVPMASEPPAASVEATTTRVAPPQELPAATAPVTEIPATEGTVPSDGASLPTESTETPAEPALDPAPDPVPATTPTEPETSSSDPLATAVSSDSLDSGSNLWPFLALLAFALAGIWLWARRAPAAGDPAPAAVPADPIVEPGDSVPATHDDPKPTTMGPPVGLQSELQGEQQGETPVEPQGKSPVEPPTGPEAEPPTKPPPETPAGPPNELPNEPPAEPAPAVDPQASADDMPAFLREQLRRREETLEQHGPPRRTKPEDDIIDLDADDFEIIEESS